jgi:hypothetical protein
MYERSFAVFIPYRISIFSREPLGNPKNDLFALQRSAACTISNLYFDARKLNFYFPTHEKKKTKQRRSIKKIHRRSVRNQYNTK